MNSNVDARVGNFKTRPDKITFIYNLVTLLPDISNIRIVKFKQINENKIEAKDGQLARSGMVG